MSKINVVANYIIKKNQYNIHTYKLHILLYLCQYHHLMKFNTHLFADYPVKGNDFPRYLFLNRLLDVSQSNSGYRIDKIVSQEILLADDQPLNYEEIDTLRLVLSRYNHESLYTLRQMVSSKNSAYYNTLNNGDLIPAMMIKNFNPEHYKDEAKYPKIDPFFKYHVIPIANYFIGHNSIIPDLNYEKLVNMLYFAQSWHLKLFNFRLFSNYFFKADDILHIDDLRLCYNTHLIESNIEIGLDVEQFNVYFSDKDISFLNRIIEVYKDLTLPKMHNLLFNFKLSKTAIPIYSANNDEVIPIYLMRKYIKTGN